VSITTVRKRKRGGIKVLQRKWIVHYLWLLKSQIDGGDLREEKSKSLHVGQSVSTLPRGGKEKGKRLPKWG